MHDAIKKLGILRMKIKYMKNTKEKALLIKDYYNIVAFLYNAGFISSINEYDFDTDDDLLYEKFYTKNVDSFIREIMDNKSSLKIIFQALINYYSQYDFSVLRYSKEIIINPKAMQGVLSSFFWNISDETLQIYFKMINEQRMIQNLSCHAEGLAINTMNTDFAYAIIANRQEDLEYYLAIVHEMGHIYMMYKRRFTPNFANIEITSEIVSLLFEKLFLYYLDVNNIVYQKKDQSHELHHSNILYFLIMSKIILELMENKQIEEIDKDLLKIYPKIPMEKIFQKLSLELGYDVSVIRDLNLASITYPIGEIISNYFFFEIIQNHDLGIQKLDEFLINLSKMDMKELISTYMVDLSNSYAYIDLFMRQKQLKKHK